VLAIPHPEPLLNLRSLSLPLHARANPSFPFRVTRPRAPREPSTSQKSYTTKELHSRLSRLESALTRFRCVFRISLKTNGYQVLYNQHLRTFSSQVLCTQHLRKYTGGRGLRCACHKSCLSPKARAFSLPPCLPASLPRAHCCHWLASACTPVLRTGHAHPIGDRIERTETPAESRQAPGKGRWRRIGRSARMVTLWRR